MEYRWSNINCAVIGCSGRDKGKSFYRLPCIIKHQGKETEILSERRRREWLSAIRRKDIKEENYQHTRVCSDHFISNKPSSLYDCTNPDWVLSLNLGYTTDTDSGTSETTCTCSSERYVRALERAAKRRKIEFDEVGGMIDDLDLTTAIFHLLSTHYVFNLSYHIRVKDILYFIQEKIMNISDPTVKKSSIYLSVTSAMECYMQSDSDDCLEV